MAKRKRGAGEGSIVRHGSGRWMVSLSDGHRNGKRYRRVKYADSHGEAVAVLRAMVREKESGRQTFGAIPKLSAYLSTWLARGEGAWRAKTMLSYRQICERHLIPALGHLAVDKLHQSQVQALLKEKLSDGLKPTTVRYIRAVLRSALGQAMREDLVTRNVAKLVRVPTGQRYRPVALEPRQTAALLAALPRHRLGAIFGLALCGLRLGEILGLQWRDLDVERGCLQIARQLVDVRGRLCLGEPKSETSRRTIKLPVFASALLSTLDAQQASEFQRANLGGRSGETFMFTTLSGGPVDHSMARRIFGDVREAAGLPQMRIHDLRHTCASLLAASGVERRMATSMLGHSDPRLTEQVYTHVLQVGQERAALALDAAVAL